MRSPTCAGTFYELAREDLMKQLGSCYKEAFHGTPPEPARERRGSILGIVSPHAGYFYSGATAARSHGEVAKDGLPSTFILLGPIHKTGQAIAVGGESFSTPLGEVPIDQELVEAIWKQPIDRLDSTHRDEHSLELQLPFIQFFGKDFSIVPLAIGKNDQKTVKKIGGILAEAIRKTGKERDIVMVASSDFSHLGLNYGNMPTEPVPEKMLEWMNKYDGIAIEKIKKLDANSLLKMRGRNLITACGTAPIAVMLTAAKKLGAVKGEKLAYTTSYAKEQQVNSIVGYASIAIMR